MLRSRDRKSTSELARRNIIRVSVVLGLLAVGIMALATGSHRSAAADSSRSKVLAERSKHRISLRGLESAPKSALTSTRLLAPLVTIDVDRTDDDAGATACTAAANDCSLRGSVAFANLNPGTVISVPAGTYQLNIAGGAVEGFAGNNSIGDLDVTADNTSIVGAGSGSTIIDQTQPNDRVLEVNPFLDADFDFSISGVTIFSGSETTGVGGGGIIAGSINNTTSVTNCVISGNSATGAGTLGGGGIQNMGGSLTLTGTTFSGNSTSSSGGALSYTAGDPLNRRPSNGTLSISGSSFSSNSANSVAAGGGGADLFNFNGSNGAYNINSSTFSGNTATSGSGGAIIVESGPLTLTTSSLSGNSAGLAGGAITSSGSVVTNYSRFVGNTVSTATNGLTIFTTNGSVTAEDNWWGTNTGASANDVRTSEGSLVPLVYLQLQINANPNGICTGGTSTLTADIKQRNAGADLTTELNGLPAFPSSPTTIFSTAVLGTLSGESMQFVNGAASATFTAGGSPGTGSTNATADNQTVTANINISQPSVSVDSPTVCASGLPATMTATVLNANAPLSFSWTGPGGFTATGNPISVTTPGTYNVTVTDANSCIGTGSGTLTVHESPTVSVNSPTLCAGSATMTATVSGGTGTITWTGPGGFTATGNPITVTTPGTYTVTVTDANGCTGSASGIATADTQPPSISCPANITVAATSPSGAVVNYVAPVGTDNCPGAVTTRTAGLASGSTFPMGTTTVTYQVTDSVNLMTSCSFTVTVTSATQIIQGLIAQVQALQPPLSGQQGQGLISKLNAALSAINNGQPNVACNKLNDFINQVQGYINNGTLSQAQGQPLINSANSARAALGCN
jgi:hypothetical protein